MGCNCKDEYTEERRKEINNLTKKFRTMAKEVYKIAKGVDENTTLILRGEKIKVKDLVQQTMKVFYLAGNPAEKEDSSAKKTK